jgi:hypothetical protein
MSDGMPDEDSDAVRSALRARLESCWDRIMDAVSELHAVHQVPREEILRRVEEVVAETND